MSASCTALAELERCPRDPHGQGFAFEQLHRDIQLAAMFTDVVKLANIGMTDARGRACLPPSRARADRPTRYLEWS